MNSTRKSVTLLWVLLLWSAPLALSSCGGGARLTEQPSEQPAESPPLDTDGDGIPDESDAFPAEPSESVDSDGDGIGDNSDTFPNDASEGADSDGDGVGDNSDNCPNVANADQTNTDGAADGGDACDDDDDNDGVADASDTFPLDAAESVDTDGDGTGDVADTDDDNDETLDTADCAPLDSTGEITVTDTSGASVCVVDDADDDNDDVADASDAFPLDARETVDTDGDGTGNNADSDDDNDTVADATDNCPLVANLDQMNTDGAADGGDACDTDDDNDTVADGADNCPLAVNADQADLDTDALGNPCDSDQNGNDIADDSGSDPDPDQLTYFAATDGSPTGTGAIDDPLTLAEAYAMADDNPALLRNVYLVTGGYLLDTPLTLTEGVSLYGGFGPLVDGTRTRESTPFGTSISGPTGDSAILSDAGVTAGTTIDGVTVIGGNSTGPGESAVAIRIFNSSPALSNISVTAGDGDVDSIAIQILASAGGTASPSITDNEAIAAGDATTGDSIGIDVGASTEGTASPTIRGNRAIRAAVAGDDSIGIRVVETDTDPATEASATIEDNLVEASVEAMTATTIGIALGEDLGITVLGFDSAQVRKNTIWGGWGSTLSVGLSIVSPEGLTEVSNNIVTAVLDPMMHPGAGDGDNLGIVLVGTGELAALVNNTISTGAAPAEASGIAALMVDDSGTGAASTPTLTNNIIYSSSMGPSFGIVEACPACDPVSLENQLFSTTLATYYMDEGTTPTSDIAVINGPVGGSANIEGSPAFVSEDMGSPSYLRIGAASAAIDAGADASALDVDGDGVTDVAVTEDIDDETRPGGASYDIGADEVP